MKDNKVGTRLARGGFFFDVKQTGGFPERRVSLPYNNLSLVGRGGNSPCAFSLFLFFHARGHSIPRRGAKPRVLASYPCDNRFVYDMLSSRASGHYL